MIADHLTLVRADHDRRLDARRQILVYNQTALTGRLVILLGGAVSRLYILVRYSTRGLGDDWRRVRIPLGYDGFFLIFRLRDNRFAIYGIAIVCFDDRVSRDIVANRLSIVLVGNHDE